MESPAPARRKRVSRLETIAAPSTDPTSATSQKESSPAPVPFLLDFYPLEEAKFTRLSRFFEALRAGRLTTTKCAKDGVAWPPRAVCPKCHTQELEWVDLPSKGHLYAFSAVLAGAPSGMESEVPFVVGLVDLEGSPLRLFGRIVGAPWTECRVGQPVTVETYQIPDGRSFYRFRTSGR